MTETTPDLDDLAEPEPPPTEGPEGDPAEAGDDEEGVGVAHADTQAPPDYEQPEGLTFDLPPTPEEPNEEERDGE